MFNELFSVAGKIALVTGASGGLGVTFASALSKAGAKVILNGTNQAKLDVQVGKLADAGYEAFGYVFDVNNSSEIRDVIDSINSDIGTIDILVNNAGITVRAPLEAFADEDWDRIIGVNLTGAYKVAKAVAHGMIAKRAGKIINIGSVQCELGRPSITPYAASKGGLKMLTKGMAVEWGKYNIQSNGIGPGYFKTDMTQQLFEDEKFNEWVCSRTPSNRWGNTDELIGALLFLSSRASDYVSGQMIYVDGGLLASV